MVKAECDVSGGLNNSLNDLCNVFIFSGEKMVAKDGLLESGKRHGIGNERFASGKIDGESINSESFKIMKAQMRDGREHHENGAEVFSE